VAEARAALLNRRDKVLPSLLDRLLVTPYSGEGKGLFVSPDRYLDSIRRDLYWLLKTEVSRTEEVLLTNPCPGEAGSVLAEFRTLAEFPRASCSVLAYGVPAQRGTQGLRSTGNDLARAIKTAIQRFEPRIVPGSVKVDIQSPDSTSDRDENVEQRIRETPLEYAGLVEFTIKGVVSMKPVSEELMLKAIYQPALAQWRIEGVVNES
jgi:predicted component of type VI protein secretion system